MEENKSLHGRQEKSSLHVVPKEKLRANVIIENIDGTPYNGMIKREDLHYLVYEYLVNLDFHPLCE